MFYMFRTILVHLHVQLYKLYIAFGIYRYMLKRTSHLVYAGTKCDVHLIQFAPDDGLIESETCRASHGK